MKKKQKHKNTEAQMWAIAATLWDRMENRLIVWLTASRLIYF